MATYIVLLSYTDQGMRNIGYLKEHPRAFRQLIEEAGGRLVHIYMTLGPYDFVATLDAPSDEECAAVVLSLGSVGNFRTLTMKAFGESELPAISDRIPSLEDQFAQIIRGLPGTGSP